MGGEGGGRRDANRRHQGRAGDEKRKRKKNEEKTAGERKERLKRKERVGREREIQGGARVLTRAATPSRFVLFLSFRLVSSHHAASVFLLQYDPRGPSASTVHHCCNRTDRIVHGRFILKGSDATAISYVVSKT